MNKNVLVFFRNDDVRGTLDKSLMQITNIFMNHKIPITHAVEPANLTKDVIDWLLDMKKNYPRLIEIIQHGYDHSIKNKFKKGEFGGQRTYEEQFQDIKRGKELMYKYFGDLWFPAFCFPYGPYNFEAMKAVSDNGFKVVNGSWEIDLKHKLFYFLAHFLRKEVLFGYRVPYNLRFRPKNKLFQINVNISFIDKYINENTESSMLTFEKLKLETIRFSKQKTIGFLIHHRYHDTDEKIKLIDTFLSWIKTQNNFKFETMEGIYKRYVFKEQ